MFTAQSLLDIAAQHEAEYRRLLVLFPPGTSNDPRNDARESMKRAIACSTWMESNGHTELAHVGSFQSGSVKKGQIVRLKKGSLVFSTAPGFPRDGKESARSQIILVHDLDSGYVDTHTNEVRQPRVNWVGAQSYWRWSDLNNFEIVAA